MSLADWQNAFKPVILVHSAATSEYSKLGNLQRTEMYFLQPSRWGSPRSRCLCWCLVRGTLAFQNGIIVLGPHVAEHGRGREIIPL